jgi:hypothetical protein
MEVASVDNSYEKLVGNSPRSVAKSATLRCLDTRELDDFTRSNFGLTEDVTGIIYLSPTHLIQQFGDWKLDARKLRLTLLDETYYCKRVKYIGHIPKFNACLAVEIRLVDTIHGGP